MPMLINMVAILDLGLIWSFYHIVVDSMGIGAYENVHFDTKNAFLACPESFLCQYS